MVLAETGGVAPRYIFDPYCKKQKHFNELFHEEYFIKMRNRIVRECCFEFKERINCPKLLRKYDWMFSFADHLKYLGYISIMGFNITTENMPINRITQSWINFLFFFNLFIYFVLSLSFSSRIYFRNFALLEQ